MTWLAVLASAWGADTWWVADEKTADQVEAALAQTWPEREVEVIVGGRPEAAEGTTWNGLLLVAYGEDGVRHAEVDDPTVAVLLARSWALPSAPTPPERYLPEAPPPPAPRVVEEIPEEPSPSQRFRLSSGIGTRGFAGQPRIAEGIRLVNELERRGVFLQSDVFLGLSLRYAPERFAEPTKEGSAWVTPMDRATIGFAMGLQSQRTVALRVLAGPELRFVEHWLFFRGTAREAAPTLALGARVGAGVDWDLGRFVVAPVGYVRVSAMTPAVSVGATLDVRYDWRR